MFNTSPASTGFFREKTADSRPPMMARKMCSRCKSPRSPFNGSTIPKPGSYRRMWICSICTGAQ